MQRLLFLVFLLFPFSVKALDITGLQISKIEGGEHVGILLNGKVSYKMFPADAPPPRLVIDLPHAHLRSGVGLPRDHKDAMIKSIRFGEHNEDVSRIVFDFFGDYAYSHVKMAHAHGGYRLEFDIMRTSGSAAQIAEAGRVTGKTKFKPVIVIDAGHGGQDVGTSGYSGSYEKDLTLCYAKALRDALSATGRYQVALTRSDDRYLLLGERVRLARAAKGNLFISIHADSSPLESAHGLSVYTISEKASDKQSEALAEKENKADIIGGMDLSDTSKDVADILIDLTQRETRDKSGKFSALLVQQLRREVILLPHSHRFAGFAVLKAPDIPSVLIEVGFLTNPHEERQLKGSTHQEKFIRGMIKAIDAYFARRGESAENVK